MSVHLRLASQGEVVITRHGRPAGGLIGFEDEAAWVDHRIEKSPIACWPARAWAIRRGSGSLFSVRIATGKVVHGKLELDGDSLEEGATVTVLVPERDETFELTPDEESALEESLNQAAAGLFVDAEALLRELRQ